MANGTGKTLYRIERRTDRKRGGGKLSSFALDIKISFDAKGEGCFIDDANGSPLAFNSIHEMKRLLDSAIDRNYVEHFDRPVPLGP